MKQQQETVDVGSNLVSNPENHLDFPLLSPSGSYLEPLVQLGSRVGGLQNLSPQDSEKFFQSVFKPILFFDGLLFPFISF